jgi:hypothetical protein
MDGRGLLSTTRRGSAAARACSSSVVPSSEPLSTTTTSIRQPRWDRIESRQRSMEWISLRAGTMTETSGASSSAGPDTVSGPRD